MQPGWLCEHTLLNDSDTGKANSNELKSSVKRSLITTPRQIARTSIKSRQCVIGGGLESSHLWRRLTCCCRLAECTQ